MKNFIKNNKNLILILVLTLLISSFSCTVEAKDANDGRLILATTTSTENSGLLDELLPPFEDSFGVRVDVVSVGTGKAIRLAENGDADIILVHAKNAEEKFVTDGYGVNRRSVMYNDFIILGPESDPAGIKGLKDASKALQKIAESESGFVSRGDDSGTNKKELSIWDSAGIEPGGSWYFETGQGMGASLNVANEKNVYILADRGTYLAYQYDGKLDLEVLVEGDSELYNPYGVIPVNPGLYSHVNYQAAMSLVGYITSQQGQKIINSYTRFGKKLFKPLAIKPANLK
jgi:tungstate transport system substrate-binding protein